MIISIMAPLGKQNIDKAFLLKLKQNGVSSISTDIWWGYVEKYKNTYDWSYYEYFLNIIKEVGLKWIPILSFHCCGGNVSDNVNIPLPQYIYDMYGEELNFVNSKKAKINEYASFWCPSILDRYECFMNAFRNHFANDSKYIQKIYISMGPAGELRFPSYNASNGWKYPDIGYLQCYSPKAIQDYQLYLQNKYEKLNILNATYKSSYSKWEEIVPPMDDKMFFNQYFHKSIYGQDLLEWYQNVLINHFRCLAKMSKKVFQKWDGIPLSVKLSGIHWKFHVGRLAEQVAGYVNYYKIIKEISEQGFDLTITCLEMENNDESGIDNILEELFAYAQSLNVKVYAENALPLNFDDDDTSSQMSSFGNWFNLHRNIKKYNIQGITILRYDNIITNVDAFLYRIKKYLI